MDKIKISTEEQLRISNSQIDQLERENARLVEQLKEVIKMNTHWQRYDSQREEYVLKLTRTNQELQDKVSDLQRQIEELGITNDTVTKKEKPKEKEQGAAENVKSDEGGHDELEALRKEEEVAELTDRVAKLKERIVELERGRESRKKEDDDQLALLREQVNVCVEDFKQERKDRERIHGENEKLRERLALATKQIQVYETRIAQLKQQSPHRHTVSKPPPRRGYDEPCCYPEERPHRHNAPVQGYRQNGYRHPMHFGDDLTDLPRDVEVDGVTDDDLQGQTETDGGPITHEPIENGEETTEVEGEDNVLQCPRCLASFDQDNHTELLKHIDKCID